MCNLADIPSVIDTMYLASSVSLLSSARLRSAVSARLSISLGLTVSVLDSASFHDIYQHRVIDDDGNVIAKDINFRVKKAGKEGVFESMLQIYPRKVFRDWIVT